MGKSIKVDIKKIESLLVDNLMTKTELAKKCGVSNHCILYITTGRRNTTRLTGAKIAKALNVTLDEILVKESSNQ